MGKIRTGIFGGSFNPIHNGHISLARQLKDKAGLDEVWLMVSPQNPLKQHSDLLNDEARLKMARMALSGEEGIIACDYEMHLSKPSYTWNTLQALSHDYPDREFVLMIGGDNWQLFRRWYHHEDIFRNYQIVVYPRKDTGEEGAQNLNSDQYQTLGHVLSPLIIEAELIEISSTDIRQRIREGRSIHNLVPQVVEEIIMKEGYYA